MIFWFLLHAANGLVVSEALATASGDALRPSLPQVVPGHIYELLDAVREFTADVLRVVLRVDGVARPTCAVHQGVVAVASRRPRGVLASVLGWLGQRFLQITESSRSPRGGLAPDLCGQANVFCAPRSPGVRIPPSRSPRTRSVWPGQRFLAEPATHPGLKI